MSTLPAAPTRKLTDAQMRRRKNAAAQRAMAVAARKRPPRDYDVHHGELTDEHRELLRQMRAREDREGKKP
jgi:hypothetical protein